MEDAAKGIKKVLDDVTQKVDPIIYKILSSAVDNRFQEIAKYQISCGGKRVRPALAVLSCLMMGGREEDVIYPAAALEILHNYTLIVDDIIDHGELRRNKPTAWKKYGTSMAECISIYYVASVFDIVKDCHDSRIYSVFAKTLKEITNGEILDILFEQRGREDEKFVRNNRHLTVTLSDYNRMISKKTAELFKACCEVGGICSDASPEEQEILKDFGLSLGMAFQVHDDTLDIFGDEDSFGKKIGKDIVERKLGNIIIFFALEDLSDPDGKNLLNILQKKSVSDKDIQRAIDMISGTNAREEAYSLESEHIGKARESLKQLPRNKWNNALLEITNYLIQRRS